MYCYNCGKQIEEDDMFCPFCGAAQEVEDVPESDETEFLNDAETVSDVTAGHWSQDEPEDSDEPKMDVPHIEDYSRKGRKKAKRRESDGQKEGGPKQPTSKKSLIIIIALACIIVACLVVLGMHYLKADTPEEPEIPADGITILDCEAGWGSAYTDDKYGAYRVNFVMYVQNGTEEDIAAVDFTAVNESGTTLVNALNRDLPFRADGYIKKGQKGIMYGTLWLNEEDAKVLPENVDLKGAYTYKGGEGYQVPIGHITKGVGLNNDSYEVKIDNPNPVEITPTATFIAILIENDKFIDEEATGRIDSAIQPNTHDNIIPGVFEDPGLKRKAQKYDIYVIDPANYQEWEEDDEN